MLIRNLRQFRLVTFDVTDTLLKFRIPPALQYAKTAASYGYDNIDPVSMQANFKSSFKEMYKAHPNFGRNTEGMEWEDWWLMLVAKILKRTEPSISESDLKSIAWKLIRQYRTEECWSEIDGASDIVNKVQQLGKAVGVISNFDPSLLDVIEAMRLPQFDFVLTSYECGAGKPSRQIFQQALDMCAISDPSQALHIGNTLELDYVGARDAGWSQLLIANLTERQIREQHVNRDHVFPTLRELLTTLESDQIKW